MSEDLQYDVEAGSGLSFFRHFPIAALAGTAWRRASRWILVQRLSWSRWYNTQVLIREVSKARMPSCRHSFRAAMLPTLYTAAWRGNAAAMRTAEDVSVAEDL